MKLTVHNREDYLKSCEVQNLPIVYNDCAEYQLFGHKVVVYDDVWMHHLHLKVTDRCNASCDFCVEKNCKKNEDADIYLVNLDKTLRAMQDAGLLYSVSVTGGEPTLFPKFRELCEVLSRYNISFLTMNTNGALINKYINEIDGLFDFINVSRHSIWDRKNNEIFHTKVLSCDELMALKSKLNHTKMRIQCVIGQHFGITSMHDFIDAYSFADDISFRRLMEVGDEYSLNYVVDKDEYNLCLKYAFLYWKFVEQTIQDYYVYEIYDTGSTRVTFSYSNMKMLRDAERVESEDFFREFILHPNGVLSGSWMQDKKILLCGKTTLQ